MNLWLTTLASVAALLGVVLSAAAVLFYRNQWREARRAAAISALLPFYQYYHSDRLRRARHRLYEQPVSYSMTREEEEELRLLLNHLEFLGALVENNLVDFPVVYSIFQHSVQDVWRNSREYVFARRRGGVDSAKDESEQGDHGKSQSNATWATRAAPPVRRYARNFELLQQRYEKYEQPKRRLWLPK